MRKIIAQEFVSLDGVIDSPENWHFPYFNEEMGQAVGAQQAGSDAILLGRQTYQEFAAFWPNQEETEEEPAGYMNDTPKYVASSTLDNADDWQNSTLIKANLAEELAELKRQPGRNIAIIGSAALVRSLLRDGLIDELQLLVHPVVVGSGKRLFADSEQVPLKLVDVKQFSTGVLLLTYGPADK